MNTRAEFQYYWTDSAIQQAPGNWEPISEYDFLEVEGRTESIAEPAGRAAPWAQDLLRVARAVYVADKRALRDAADDQWTRTIRLSVPLCVPDLWTGTPGTHLHELLTTLTGDRWEVEIRPGGHVRYYSQKRIFDDWRTAEVALLSGGLDSTAFAADLARREGGDVAFVMFYDSRTKNRQAEIYDRVVDLSRRPVHRRQVSQTVLGKGGSLEQTSRSRGLDRKSVV